MSSIVGQEIVLNGLKTMIDGSSSDRYVEDSQIHAHSLSPLFEYAKTLLRPDDVVYDVGANVGLTTIGLARLVPGGKVRAFEPSRANAERLRRNLSLNAINNVEVIEAAVSAQPGDVHFVDVLESGSASHVDASQSETNVPAVTLDALWSEAGGRGPALIKIDVEGHEPWVLDGAVNLISQARPKLWMEFNAWCLMAFGSVHPLEFAKALFSDFAGATTSDGKSLTPVADYISFTHDYLIKDGCVTDLLLELRDGRVLQASFAPKDQQSRQFQSDVALKAENARLLQRCNDLEKEVSSLRTSTSWQVTSPLRALKRISAGH